MLVAAALAANAADASAQYYFPARQSIHVRIGAMAATALVRDMVSTPPVDSTYPGARSDEIVLQQAMAPIASVAWRLPLRQRAQFEAALSAARSNIEGDDTFETWRMAPATVANLTIGIGWLYKPFLVLRGGVGLTKMFVAERGIFSEGSDITPLFEVGASTGFPVAARSIDLDVRLQSFNFGTEPLRRSGGSDGNVARVIVQLGTTVWGGR